MSDNETPSWLTGEDMLSRAAPVTADQIEQITQPQPQPQPRHDPETGEIHADDWDEVEGELITEIAGGLIAFKRFWQWPAGTRNEITSAKECAALIIGMVSKYANKS